MVTSPSSQLPLNTPYQCRTALNLYQSPTSDSLVTQAAAGRQFQIEKIESWNTLPDAPYPALYVRLLEDDYPGWLRLTHAEQIAIAPSPYCPESRTRTEIEAVLPQVIEFTHQAMAQPNEYLWGGTVAPNYDCSGLMQTAFANAGIWIPRDAYQQEDFTDAIAVETLQPGDLVFFGTPAKANHVGLYLGDNQYIHSSGRDQGRNGIGIDCLSEQGDAVSQTYFRQLRGAGRVMQSWTG